jgi:hypothetical protein
LLACLGAGKENWGFDTKMFLYFLAWQVPMTGIAAAFGSEHGKKASLRRDREREDLIKHQRFPLGL